MLDRFEPVRVLDSDTTRVGHSVLGIRIEALDSIGSPPFSFHVAIGDANARFRVWNSLTEAGGAPITLIHPGAHVSDSAVVHGGCVVAASATVAPESRLGFSCIVNHGAVVDHDCHVGDFSHIAPNATLGGGSIVGRRTLVGAGAVILPGVRVGSNSIIAAGAVIPADVPDRELWAGVPAKFQKALIDGPSE
jgi:sugar O-acyltransferase (sialic acid O-acetyltransferase NeuD family)